MLGSEIVVGFHHVEKESGVGVSIRSFVRDRHPIKHDDIEGIHIQSLCFREMVFIVMPLPLGFDVLELILDILSIEHD